MSQVSSAGSVYRFQITEGGPQLAVIVGRSIVMV